MTGKGFIGVDLDGTLAVYEGWRGYDQIGAPIPYMRNKVRDWLESGQEVWIVTARGTESFPAIRLWCKKYLGRILPVTNRKDFGMIRLYDDRAVQVIPNKGVPVNLLVRDAREALVGVMNDMGPDCRGWPLTSGEIRENLMRVLNILEEVPEDV